MTDTAETKTRTITMTDRPPVKIRESEWPVIGRGEYDRADSPIRSQANRTWKCTIVVRQHDDGRAVVYGVYDYGTAWQGERNFGAKAGLLLGAGDDIVGAIHNIGATLTAAADEAGREFGPHISEAVRDCIADLPAEEI